MFCLFRRVRIELAAALARVTPGMLQQTIFASSGSEAVEAAIKTAIMATGRTSVLAFEGGECCLPILTTLKAQQRLAGRGC